MKILLLIPLLLLAFGAHVEGVRQWGRQERGIIGL